MKYPSLYPLFLSLLLTPGHALAEKAGKAPDAAAFFTDPALSLAQLSPQGHYVAVVVTTDDGKQILTVRDTTDLKKFTVPISSPASEKIAAVRWINENRLGFTLKNYRDESDPTLDEFAIDRDGGNVVLLISGTCIHG